MNNYEPENEVGIPSEQEIEDEANLRRGIFSYFRVAKVEYSKFFTLGAMFGIIGFIYSFMRILKDMFVMARQDPTTIMFIKIFYILPVSFALVGLIQYLLNRRSVSDIFNIFCVGFASLFFLFAFVIVVEDYVSVTKNLFDSYVKQENPSRILHMAKPMLLTIREPLATFVFITAEMWGSLLLAYLFLSFLNECCSVGQFNRFIPPLYIITNLALLLSANVTGLFFWLKKKLSPDHYQYLLASVFLIQGMLTIGVILLKAYLEKVVMVRPIFVPKQIHKKTTKEHVGYIEGIKTMSKSKLLLAMSLTVLFFNVTYNMIESTFKSGVKVGAMDKNIDKGEFSGKLNQIDQYMTSIVVIGLNLSSFSTLVETRSWLVVSLVTPMITFLALVFTLGSAMYNTSAENSGLSVVNTLINASSPNYFIENYSGIFFLSLLKIAKYSAFDICKERLGMRIDPLYRARFKSVYDGIFGKLGKSIGSIYGLLMLGALATDDLRKAIPITGPIIFIFFIIWMRSTYYLSKRYDKSVIENCSVDIDLFQKEKQLEEQKLRKKLENQDVV